MKICLYQNNRLIQFDTETSKVETIKKLPSEFATYNTFEFLLKLYQDTTIEIPEDYKITFDGYLSYLMNQQKPAIVNSDDLLVADFEGLLKAPAFTKDQQTLFDNIEFPYAKVMAKSLAKGILCKKSVVTTLMSDIKNQMIKNSTYIKAELNIDLNPNSNKCLGQIFDKLCLVSPKKTRKGAYSYNDEAFNILLQSDLSEYNRNMLLLIKQQKSLSSKFSALTNLQIYVENWDLYKTNAILRPHISQIGEDGTSRVYSTNPSLNQMPMEFRQSIFPHNNMKFVHIDWSVAELQILATLSKDKTLLKALELSDFHKATASALFNVEAEQVTSSQREIAKTLNYAINYGISAHSIAKRYSKSLEEAEKIMSDYNRIYSKSTEYRKMLVDYGRKHNAILTAFNRIRKFTPSDDLESLDRQYVNTHIQGTCADLFKICIKRLGNIKDITVLFGVFDSFLLEVPIDWDEADIRQALSNVIDRFKVTNIFTGEVLDLTFNYKIGISDQNWYEAIKEAK